MTAPWLPPPDLKFTCNIGDCREVVEGVEASVDHIRVIHLDHYEPPERWADGGIVYDTSDLANKMGPEVLSE